MNSKNRFSERFSQLFNDIDTQLSQLNDFNSYCSHSTLTNDVRRKRSTTMKILDKEIENVINAAKEFDKGAKNFIKKSVKETFKDNKKKMKKKNSSIPPIWDEKKLDGYIEGILSGITIPSDEEEEENEDEEEMPEIKIKALNVNTDAQKPLVKSILKSDKSKDIKRHVGTNVKFLIHASSEKDVKNLHEKPNKNAKTKISRKTQTIKMNDSEMGFDTFTTSGSGTLFPCRVERVVNEDEYHDVNFEKSSQKPDERRDNMKKSAKIATKLNISPTFVTSTNGRENTIEKNDNNVVILNSNQATKTGKQMSSVILPVLSILCKCQIKKIYQIDILPVSDDKRKCCDEIKENTKLYEYVFQQPHQQNTQSKLPVQSVNENEHQKALKVNADNGGDLVNLQEFNKILNDHGIRFNDGKVHVVVDNGVKRVNKKRKMRKDFKVASLKSTIDKAVTPSKKLNEQRVKEKSHPLEKDDNFYDMNSSLSSSVSDNGKLDEILKAHRYKSRENIKARNNIKRHTSVSSSNNDSSCSSSKNYSHKLTVNEVKKSNELEFSLTENFQSIYKLIEDTFQSNTTATEANEKSNDIENGVGDINRVIKLSEENIKKAGLLLERHKIGRNAALLSSSLKVEKKSPPKRENSSKFETFDRIRGEILPSAQSNDKSDETNLFKMCQDESSNVKSKALDQNVGMNEVDPTTTLMQCHNYQTFADDLHESLRKLDSSQTSIGIQTTNDKDVQTDGNSDWKSRYYFKSVYEKYPCIESSKPPLTSNCDLSLHISTDEPGTYMIFFLHYINKR